VPDLRPYLFMKHALKIARGRVQCTRKPR
jgi:hypothetical protein